MCGWSHTRLFTSCCWWAWVIGLISESNNSIADETLDVIKCGVLIFQMRKLRSRGWTYLPSVILPVGDSQVWKFSYLTVVNRRKRPAFYVIWILVSPLLLVSKIRTFGGSSGERVRSKAKRLYTVKILFWFFSCFCFFPSICFMMVKILHGATSVLSHSSQKPRAITPSTRSPTLKPFCFPNSSQILPSLSILTNTALPPSLSSLTTVLQLSFCWSSLFQCLISQWQKLPVVLHFHFFLAHFPACPAAGCDHVTKFWPMGGGRRVMWQFLEILKRRLVGTFCSLLQCPFFFIYFILFFVRKVGTELTSLANLPLSAWGRLSLI